MNTGKTNFWCKKSYKDRTHHTLLLNLPQHSDNPSSSAQFVSVGSQHTQDAVWSQPGKLWPSSEQRGETPCWLCHLSHVTVTGRITKNRSFVDIPLPERRKKICKGMAKKDGRIPTMSYQQIWLACLLSRKAATWGDPWMSRIPVDSTFISMFDWHGNGSKWDRM